MSNLSSIAPTSHKPGNISALSEIQSPAQSTNTPDSSISLNTTKYSEPSDPSDPTGVTGQLCNWVYNLQLNVIPAEVQERAKYLILDGLACAFTGAHVPWSEDAVNAMLAFEEPGCHVIIGWEKKLGPLAATLLNGTLIQATELDDFHSVAPLHSASVLLPALIAASEYANKNTNSDCHKIKGSHFLLACIVGFESGPRVGMALNGGHMLSLGWHSGPIFGHPAAAAASAKILGLNARQMEDAIGIACTQAGGLMAAEKEGSVKRMQHAFAARNGLFGALMAKGGYIGIRKVFERKYGGFLSQFSLGFEEKPRYHEDEIVKELGAFWQTKEIRTKMYACNGGAHGLIQAIAELQVEYAERMSELEKIEKVAMALSKPVFSHGGWKAEGRPLTTTGAQMNAGFIAASQLVDQQVLLAQFSPSRLNRDRIWTLMPKIECLHDASFDHPDRGCGARVTVTFSDGATIENTVLQPRGFDPPFSNQEILAKWRRLTDGILESGRRDRIEQQVLGLESLENLESLLVLLSGTVLDPMTL